MKLKKIIFLVLISLIFNACSKENTLQSDPFVIAFENLSYNIMDIEEHKNIKLVFSQAALEKGYLQMNVQADKAIYGIDYTTIPPVENGVLQLDFLVGDKQKEIEFQKLSNAFDETTNIQFTIQNIFHDNAQVQGQNKFVLNASANLGGDISPNIGGANQPNSVYIDLSTGKFTAVKRDSWALGFYSGEAFRVVLNSSIYMAAAPVDYTDIDQVNAEVLESMKPEIAVGTFNPENEDYVDNPNGDILDTAFTEVSVELEENKVYLLNLGYEVATETPVIGSVAIAGNHRGWRKVRVIRENGAYILQHATLESNTHQRLKVEKKEAYNFTFVNILNHKIVEVEPQKKQWDISFSVFTNVIPGSGSYGFSDFVVHNRKANVKAYVLENSSIPYDNFELQDVIENNFEENQTVIGSSWRDVFLKQTFDHKYYILKDINNNIYKLKFLGLTNEQGERGNSKFKYKLLK